MIRLDYIIPPISALKRNGKRSFSESQVNTTGIKNGKVNDLITFALFSIHQSVLFLGNLMIYKMTEEL